MGLILNIDTSTSLASMSLAQGGITIATISNSEQKGHAAWIHDAINELISSSGNKMTKLDAVGLTSGPGSYTGLRVGMATAKGLCYALKIPLIAVDTLFAMAYAMRNEPTDLLCPMMDAGRMEVYTAMYNSNLDEISKPQPKILDLLSFYEELESKSITFFGSGKNKFQEIQKSPKALFADHNFQSADIDLLMHERFIKFQFSSLAYVEPSYLKGYT